MLDPHAVLTALAGKRLPSDEKTLVRNMLMTLDERRPLNETQSLRIVALARAHGVELNGPRRDFLDRMGPLVKSPPSPPLYLRRMAAREAAGL